ncbi:MAG TPA: hypothetical protein VF290_21530 [Pyrinomonadaceae bacterium]
MSDTEPQWAFENPLSKSLEEMFQDKAPEWKIVSAWHGDDGGVSSEWSDGDSKVIVQIARLASPEELSTHLQLFAWHIPLKAADFEEVMRDPANYQLPPPVMPDARLPNLDMSAA